MALALREYDGSHDSADALAYTLCVDSGNKTFEEVCIAPSYMKGWREFFTPQFKKGIDEFIKRHSEKVAKFQKAPLLHMYLGEVNDKGEFEK